ncbi:hypothetical protein EC34870_0439B, partial [Escherichia coli 3.4870]
QIHTFILSTLTSCMS